MRALSPPVALAVLLAAAPVALPGAALAEPLPPDLARAQAAFDHAQIAGDELALERFLAPGYTLVNGDGALEDRAAFIADWTRPGFDPDPVQIREPVELVWADGAVLGGLVTLTGADGGKRFSVTFRYLDIWRFQDGRWQVVRGQSTRVRE